MENDFEEKPKMSIWWFIAIMFFLYGIIIFITGIYYLFKPPGDYGLAYLHPSIWWGAILFIAGLIFYFVDRKARKNLS